MTLDLRRSLLLPSILATVAIVAGCSSGTGATTAPSVAAPTTAASEAPASEPASEAPSAAASPAAGAVSLALADSTLGKIIVDGAGKTLYMFTPDEAGSPTCYDQCAAAWPALKADDAASVTVGAGLDATKLSVVDRTDGGKQLKYGTWPLYYFANDAAAGDVNGQGAGEGKWWVVGADGEPIKTT